MTTPGTALKFRKKPGAIEAMQFTGDNVAAVLAFVGEHGWYSEWAEHHGRVPGHFKINTRHGPVNAMRDDWIIRGEHGDYWPCKPDIFETTYDQTDGPTYDELMEILEGVVDCAIWQSGAVAYAADSAWSEMREKLNRGIAVTVDREAEELLTEEVQP